MNEFIIWAAGFFDGEGGVTIRRPFYELAVSVTNTCKPVIELFQQRYDGHIGTTPSGGGGKLVCYQFVFSWEAAKQFLIEVMPYLLVRKAEAQLALDYISTISNLASLRGGRSAGRKMTGLD